MRLAGDVLGALKIDKTKDNKLHRHRSKHLWSVSLYTKLWLQLWPVYLKTNETTTRQDGASLLQLAAISSPWWRDGSMGQPDDGTSNMFSHTNCMMSWRCGDGADLNAVTEPDYCVHCSILLLVIKCDNPVLCVCSWCTDTSHLRHFKPKTFRHHVFGAKVSRIFAVAPVPKCLGSEVS